MEEELQITYCGVYRSSRKAFGFRHEPFGGGEDEETREWNETRCGFIDCTEGKSDARAASENLSIHPRYLHSSLLLSCLMVFGTGQ